MKLNYSKEWFANRLKLEGDFEIGAGIPPSHRNLCLPREATSKVDTRIALGQFVELWRRDKGWDAEKLAMAANIDPEEILEIEHDPQCIPEPDAVYRLASVFGIPTGKLMELAGLTESRTDQLREKAIRFAARSESIAALSHHEREAFEAFVTELSEEDPS